MEGLNPVKGPLGKQNISNIQKKKSEGQEPSSSTEAVTHANPPVDPTIITDFVLEKTPLEKFEEDLTKLFDADNESFHEVMNIVNSADLDQTDLLAYLNKDEVNHKKNLHSQVRESILKGLNLNEQPSKITDQHLDAAKDKFTSSPQEKIMSDIIELAESCKFLDNKMLLRVLTRYKINNVPSFHLSCKVMASLRARKPELHRRAIQILGESLHFNAPNEESSVLQDIYFKLINVDTLKQEAFDSDAVAVLERHLLNLSYVDYVGQKLRANETHAYQVSQLDKLPDPNPDTEFVELELLSEIMFESELVKIPYGDDPSGVEGLSKTDVSRRNMKLLVSGITNKDAGFNQRKSPKFFEKMEVLGCKHIDFILGRLGKISGFSDFYEKQKIAFLELPEGQEFKAAKFESSELCGVEFEKIRHSLSSLISTVSDGGGNCETAFGNGLLKGKQVMIGGQVQNELGQDLITALQLSRDLLCESLSQRVGLDDPGLTERQKQTKAERNTNRHFAMATIHYCIQNGLGLTTDETETAKQDYEGPSDYKTELMSFGFIDKFREEYSNNLLSFAHRAFNEFQALEAQERFDLVMMEVSNYLETDLLHVFESDYDDDFNTVDPREDIHVALVLDYLVAKSFVQLNSNLYPKNFSERSPEDLEIAGLSKADIDNFKALSAEMRNQKLQDCLDQKCYRTYRAFYQNFTEEEPGQEALSFVALDNAIERKSMTLLTFFEPTETPSTLFVSCMEGDYVEGVHYAKTLMKKENLPSVYHDHKSKTMDYLCKFNDISTLKEMTSFLEKKDKFTLLGTSISKPSSEAFKLVFQSLSDTEKQAWITDNIDLLTASAFSQETTSFVEIVFQDLDKEQKYKCLDGLKCGDSELYGRYLSDMTADHQSEYIETVLSEKDYFKTIEESNLRIIYETLLTLMTAEQKLRMICEMPFIVQKVKSDFSALKDVLYKDVYTAIKLVKNLDEKTENALWVSICIELRAGTNINAVLLNLTLDQKIKLVNYSFIYEKKDPETAFFEKMNAEFFQEFSVDELDRIMSSYYTPGQRGFHAKKTQIYSIVDKLKTEQREGVLKNRKCGFLSLFIEQKDVDMLSKFQEEINALTVSDIQEMEPVKGFSPQAQGNLFNIFFNSENACQVLMRVYKDLYSTNEEIRREIFQHELSVEDIKLLYHLLPAELSEESQGVTRQEIFGMPDNQVQTVYHVILGRTGDSVDDLLQFFLREQLEIIDEEKMTLKEISQKLTKPGQNELSLLQLAFTPPEDGKETDSSTLYDRAMIAFSKLPHGAEVFMKACKDNKKGGRPSIQGLLEHASADAIEKFYKALPEESDNGCSKKGFLEMKFSNNETMFHLIGRRDKDDIGQLLKLVLPQQGGGQEGELDLEASNKLLICANSNKITPLGCLLHGQNKVRKHINPNAMQRGVRALLELDEGAQILMQFFEKNPKSRAALIQSFFQNADIDSITQFYNLLPEDRKNGFTKQDFINFKFLKDETIYHLLARRRTPGVGQILRLFFPLKDVAQPQGGVDTEEAIRRLSCSNSKKATPFSIMLQGESDNKRYYKAEVIKAGVKELLELDCGAEMLMRVFTKNPEKRFDLMQAFFNHVDLKTITKFYNQLPDDSNNGLSKKDFLALKFPKKETIFHLIARSSKSDIGELLNLFLPHQRGEGMQGQLEIPAVLRLMSKRNSTKVTPFHLLLRGLKLKGNVDVQTRLAWVIANLLPKNMPEDGAVPLFSTSSFMEGLYKSIPKKGTVMYENGFYNLRDCLFQMLRKKDICEQGNVFVSQLILRHSKSKHFPRKALEYAVISNIEKYNPLNLKAFIKTYTPKSILAIKNKKIRASLMIAYVKVAESTEDSKNAIQVFLRQPKVPTEFQGFLNRYFFDMNSKNEFVGSLTIFQRRSVLHEFLQDRILLAENVDSERGSAEAAFDVLALVRKKFEKKERAGFFQVALNRNTYLPENTNNNYIPNEKALRHTIFKFLMFEQKSLPASLRQEIEENMKKFPRGFQSIFFSHQDPALPSQLDLFTCKNTTRVRRLIAYIFDPEQVFPKSEDQKKCFAACTQKIFQQDSLDPEVVKMVCKFFNTNPQLLQNVLDPRKTNQYHEKVAEIKDPQLKSSIAALLLKQMSGQQHLEGLSEDDAQQVKIDLHWSYGINYTELFEYPSPNSNERDGLMAVLKEAESLSKSAMKDLEKVMKLTGVHDDIFEFKDPKVRLKVLKHQLALFRNSDKNELQPAKQTEVMDQFQTYYYQENQDNNTRSHLLRLMNDPLAKSEEHNLSINAWRVKDLTLLKALLKFRGIEEVLSDGVPDDVAITENDHKVIMDAILKYLKYHSDTKVFDREWPLLRRLGDINKEISQLLPHEDGGSATLRRISQNHVLPDITNNGNELRDVDQSMFEQ